MVVLKNKEVVGKKVQVLLQVKKLLQRDHSPMGTATMAT